VRVAFAGLDGCVHCKAVVGVVGVEGFEDEDCGLTMLVDQGVVRG
jgi:hypothetical protein